MESKYNINNAIQFKERINNTYILDDEIMISLDVVSLFPSIPVDFAINIIESKWDDIKKFTNMTKRLFINILRFCIIDNRYFMYDNKIYSQQKGMPMGSPASPVIADIVMEQLLDKSIQELRAKPRSVTKYVDDLFAIVKISAIHETLQKLNSFHKDIQFTIEEEMENRPYLDTMVIKHNNHIKIDWYQKPIASGRLINFYSKHPKRIIINTANNFIRRVLNISDRIFHNDNIIKIKQILSKNGFPNKVITKLINQQRNKTPEKHDKPAKIYRAITYVPGFSERLTNSKIIDEEKYEIAMKTDNTLKKLFSNTKSKLDKKDKSNVIYKINCKGDGLTSCNMSYIGTTKSKLKTRVSAHKSDQKTYKINMPNKTALATHCARNNHVADFERAEILQQETNYNKRFTLEMLHIINTPAQKRMNYKTDTENCAHSYRHLIRQHSKTST